MVLELATIVAGVKSSSPALSKTGEVLGNVLKDQKAQDPALAAAQAKLRDGTQFALCLSGQAPKESLLLVLRQIEAIRDAFRQFQTVRSV